MTGEPGRRFEQYIGDAVYIYADQGGNVVLYTSDGLSETNRVVMEPSVVMAFEKWLSSAREKSEHQRAEGDSDG